MTKRTSKDYEPTSGLADDFDAKITARFDHVDAYDEFLESQGKDPQPMLVIEFEPDDPEIPEFEQGYGIGTKWEATQGGKAVEKGEATSFNKKSNAFKFVSSMLTAIGDGDYDVGVKYMIENGGPLMIEAAFYDGLKFRFNRKENKVVSGEEKEILLATTFLGAGKKAAAKTTTKKAAEPSSNGLSEYTEAVLSMLDEMLALPEDERKLSAMKQMVRKSEDIDSNGKTLLLTQKGLENVLEEQGVEIAGGLLK